MFLNIIKKIFYLFFPLICGSLIGVLISNFMDYSSLVKPPIAPPGYIFPIAWSIIYLLLGLSFLLYKSKNNSPTLDKVYYLSLAINLLWSIFFFIFKWYLFTCIWTIILLLSVIYLLKLFYYQNRISFYLNLPYLIWLTFATYLTFSIYFLN